MMERSDYYFLFGFLLFVLSIYLLTFYKKLINKWKDTFNTESKNETERIKSEEAIKIRQLIGTIITILGSIFFILKGFKII